MPYQHRKKGHFGGGASKREHHVPLVKQQQHNRTSSLLMTKAFASSDRNAGYPRPGSYALSSNSPKQSPREAHSVNSHSDVNDSKGIRPDRADRSLSSYSGKTVRSSPLRRSLEEKDGQCNLCDFRGFITYSNGEFADAKLCSCIDEICPKCGGSEGTEVTLESGSVAWKPCSCLLLKRRMMLYRNAKIPAHFASKTMDAFSPDDDSQGNARTHLYNTLRGSSSEVFKPGDPGVILMGPSGVGKTHLMVGYIRHLIMKFGIPCRFQDFGGLLATLRDCYARNISENYVLKPLMTTDVLVLDDLGKGRNSKWESGIIDTLISHRYNSGRSTFVTTNYTDQVETTLRERFRGRGSTEGEELLMRDTLEDRLGIRVYSRLKEMCHFLYIRGVDYRLKEAKERDRGFL